MSGQSFFAVVQTFFGITPALVYLVAGLQRHGGDLSAGTIVAFTTLQTRLLFPIGQPAAGLARRAVLARAVRADLRATSTCGRASSTRPTRACSRGVIRARRVRARLVPLPERGEAGDGRPARRWALRDVSLVVEPGQLAAIVGPSGAGKTTMSYLVPRLYDVDAAAVGSTVTTSASSPRPRSRRDRHGHPGELPLRRARSREPALRAPRRHRGGAGAAARAANIHDRILSLADGYDTVVGERGYRLSGGESSGWPSRG